MQFLFLKNQRFIAPLKVTCVLLVAPLFTACGNTMQALENQIQSFGYITFKTPVENSGTGTMVGGSPRNLSFVAGPQTCFPDPTAEGAIPLRHVDNANLPSFNQSLTFDGKLKIEIMKFLGNGSGNGLFKLNAGFDNVSSVEIEFGDAKIEYIDSVVLGDYYQEQMTETCKDFLDKVGFIIQALRVDTLKFKFKRSAGSTIELTMDNIKDYIDIAANVNWKIEQNTTLTITSPKYVGYQLGNLVRESNGHSLYRASKTRNNKFIFEYIGVFEKPKQKLFTLGKVSEDFAENFDSMDTQNVRILKSQLIKPHSKYYRSK